MANYRVLAAIASGDQRASRIATKLALGKPTISASVESLCKRGLLARSGVEGDQRGATLQLTSEGKSVAQQYRDGHGRVARGGLRQDPGPGANTVQPRLAG